MELPSLKEALDGAERAESDVRRAQELESAVEAVDEGQRLLVELDRRVNQTREGLRALQKSMSRRKGSAVESDALPARYFAASPAEPSPRSLSNEQWLLLPGGFFLLTTPHAALKKLETEQAELNALIDEAREELKAAVCEVARLEGPDSALARLNAGFDLKPVRNTA